MTAAPALTAVGAEAEIEARAAAATPLLRGPHAHSVTWRIIDDWIEGRVTCHATEGADCRVQCLDGCESWSAVDHEHPLVDQGTCNFVEWMEAADSVTEAHVGDHALVDGFIDPEWDDDHYVWSYVEGPESNQRLRAAEAVIVGRAIHGVTDG